MGCASSAPRRSNGNEDDGNGINGLTRASASRADAPTRVKLCVLGASDVGKTSLAMRFVKGSFNEECKATIGAAFASHVVRLSSGMRVKFEIWDTAGQERYASLAPLYYRGASAAFVVFDVSDRESFERAKYWARELALHAEASANARALVGNKVDRVRASERMRDGTSGEGGDGQDLGANSESECEWRRAVTRLEAEALCEELGMTAYVETSAKTGEGVSEAFELVARAVAAKNAARMPSAEEAHEASAHGVGARIARRRERA